MSATLEELRGRVQNLGGYFTDTNAAQNDAINGAYLKLAGFRRWPWLEVVNMRLIDALEPGDNQFELTRLPGFLHLDAIRLEAGTIYVEPNYMRPQEFRTLEHFDRTTGVPTNYTHSEQRLFVYPAVNDYYTVDVDYVKRPDRLVNDDDECVVPAAYEDAVVWGAIVYMTHRERDWDAHASAQTSYASIVQDMVAEYGLRQRQQATHVVESGALNYLDVEDSGLWPG